MLPNPFKSATSTTQSSLQVFDLAQTATVDEAILPGKAGRVRFLSTWWPARCQQNVTLLPGQRLQVMGHDNITLLVKPVGENLHQYLAIENGSA